MGTAEIAEFNKLAEVCESRYEAVRWISIRSRQIARENSRYRISESDLVKWALTGQRPFTDKQFKQLRRVSRIDELEYLIECVTDDQVKDNVRDFYRKSVRNRKLTLCDNDDLGESRRSRVNVLLRMAWFNYNEI